jgi:hypothetical protein
MYYICSFMKLNKEQEKSFVRHQMGITYLDQ